MRLGYEQTHRYMWQLDKHILFFFRLFTHNNQRIMYTQSKYFYKILGLSLASVGTFYFPQVEFDIFYWRHKNVEIKNTKKKKK